MPRANLTMMLATAAISLGIVGQNDLQRQDEPVLSRSDILIVENTTQKPSSEEKSKESAKMDGQETSQTGGSDNRSENDTKKVEQPARSNPTSTRN